MCYDKYDLRAVVLFVAFITLPIGVSFLIGVESSDEFFCSEKGSKYSTIQRGSAEKFISAEPRKLYFVFYVELFLYY